MMAVFYFTVSHRGSISGREGPAFFFWLSGGSAWSLGAKHVLSGGHVFVMPEYLNKIAGICEAAVVGNFGERTVGINHLLAGYLNPVKIEVINGRAVRQFLEIAAEIAGVQVGA